LAEKTSSGKMLGRVIRRFLIPQFVVCLYYYVKCGAKISPRAEVELSPLLTFGKGCRVSSFTKIKASEGSLTIGSRCGFGTGCFLSSGEQGLEIGDNLVCGANVSIVANSYRTDKLDVHLHDQGTTSKGTRIGRNVWIGAGTVILDGSVVGDNTIIAANSLINRRYPPNSYLHGNPAKPVRGFRRG